MSLQIGVVSMCSIVVSESDDFRVYTGGEYTKLLYKMYRGCEFYPLHTVKVTTDTVYKTQMTTVVPRLSGPRLSGPSIIRTRWKSLFSDN